MDIVFLLIDIELL